jgi:hypothetical protein
MKSLLAALLIVLCFAFAPVISHAQLRIEGSSSRTQPPATTRTNDTLPGAPIDGGLSLLVAAGVGYASKKAYNKRKKEKGNSPVEK